MIIVLSAFLGCKAYADHLSGLTIFGQYQPSTVGTFPVTSDFSWLWLEFAGGARFSWRFGPGTDGGIVFGQAQPHPPYDSGSGYGTAYGTSGTLTDVFTFLNEPTVFFSAAGGIAIAADDSLDLSNLRLFRGVNEVNLGAGVAADVIVPLVADITALPKGKNGWQLRPDGSYLLVYYTAFAGAPMALHLAGTAIPMPPPTVTGFWPSNGPANTVVFVFGSGFAASGSEVRVNGLPVGAVHVLSDKLLLFLLPPGDVAGPLTITTPSGSTTSSTSFGAVVSGLLITGIWPPEGSTNTIVFVFGSGFVPGATEVAVNGVRSQAVQVVSDGMLLFMLPAGATTGPVSVTTPGASVTSSESLRVR